MLVLPPHLLLGDIADLLSNNLKNPQDCKKEDSGSIINPQIYFVVRHRHSAIGWWNVHRGSLCSPRHPSADIQYEVSGIKGELRPKRQAGAHLIYDQLYSTSGSGDLRRRQERRARWQGNREAVWTTPPPAKPHTRLLRMPHALTITGAPAHAGNASRRAGIDSLHNSLQFYWLTWRRRSGTLPGPCQSWSFVAADGSCCVCRVAFSCDLDAGLSLNSLP